ncbi:hypothetical protein F4780DRAFT_744384 [Xylariomycetidae sp. FL0641]|nr:hypothetical protein F4780DRAFT_744384 [Xylariomycetidae sp. FL0641]
MRVTGLLSASLAAAVVSVHGHYNNTCGSPALVDIGTHKWLQAQCTDDQNRAPCSVLDIDVCYGNNDGVIVPWMGGNFLTKVDQKCVGCTLDGTKLSCLCQLKDPDLFNTSTIDTDKLLENENGYLKCYDTVATLSDCRS